MRPFGVALFFCQKTCIRTIEGRQRRPKEPLDSSNAAEERRKHSVKFQAMPALRLKWFQI